MSTHWIDGRKVGRNENCPCGSLMKFKDCCEYFVLENIRDVDDRVGAYLSSHELWAKRKPTPEGIFARLKQFDSKDLFQFLCKIGVALQGEIHTKTPKLEVGLLRLIFDDVWYRKVILWLQSGKRVKVIHRPLLLATLRMLLLANNQGKLVQGNEKEIGPLLLDINSISVEKDYNEKNQGALGEKDQRRALFASMVRLGFYSNTEDFGSGIARFWAIHTHGFQAVKEKYPNEFFDFETHFREAFGLTYSEMLSLSFGIIQHYKRDLSILFKTPEEFNLSERFFRTIDEKTRDRVKHVFSYLALPWDKHVVEIEKQTDANPQQFFSFYDHPLMEIVTGVFFPIDMDFLEYKMTAGAYWQLFNYLKESDERKQLERLRASMGRATEWFACKLLRTAFPDSGTTGKALWLDWDGDLRSTAKGHSIPDAIVIEEKTAYVIEITASSLLPSEIISGDPGVLENGLRRIWFERIGRSPGKLRQLQDAIESFATQKTTLRGGDYVVERIVPVLVGLRYVPQITLLNRWYKELMVEHGLTSSFAENIQIIDLEELEKLTSLKLQGISWNSIFQQKYSSTRRDSTVDDFLHSQGYKIERNADLKVWLKEVYEMTFKTLFNKPLPEDLVKR